MESLCECKCVYFVASLCNEAEQWLMPSSDHTPEQARPVTSHKAHI